MKSVARRDFVGNQEPEQPSPAIQRYFEISLLLMLGVGFFTLASTGRLDAVSVALVSAALLGKFWSYARGLDWSLDRRAVTRLAVAYIFFYTFDFLVLAGGAGAIERLLAATVHLVLFATVVKVFSAKTYRDYGYLAALSFLMMLASSILTVGASYLAGFALYVLSAISTFISYEIKRSSEAALGAARSRDSGLGVGEETITGAKRDIRTPMPEGGAGIRNSESGIRAGRVLGSKPESRNGNPGGSAIEKALMGTTLALALGIALLAAVLFFLIPRYRSGYLNALATQSQNITGFSERVDLGDIGKILRSNAVVMRVMVEGSPRSFEGVKWRGIGLTSFDGRHWYDDNTDQLPIRPEPPEHFVVPASRDQANAAPGRPRRPLRYRVLLSPVSTDVLFAAAAPREVSGRFRLVSVDETGSLHNPGHISTLATAPYEIVSETALASPAELRGAPADYSQQVRLIYLSLPHSDPRVAALARRITASAANNYDRALAVQNYLRSDFGYTLDPRGIDPADPVGSFLFQAKQGYCEYFAAAMAVMLRSIGIPARLVNGFQTGSYNPIGKDFVVRARNAHSWVEVYFPGHGWVPFDPTPADPNAAAGLGALDDYLDAASLFWNEWVINYDFAHQVRLAADLEAGSREFQDGMRQQLASLESRGAQSADRLEAWLVNRKFLVLVSTLLLLALLAFAGSLPSLAHLRLLWTWKVGRQDTAAGPRLASFAYQEFLGILRKRGFRKQPSQTPQEFALSLTTGFRQPAEGLATGSDFIQSGSGDDSAKPGGRGVSSSVLEFTRVYNALRFGSASVSLARLRDVLREIEKQ